MKIFIAVIALAAIAVVCVRMNLNMLVKLLKVVISRAQRLKKKKARENRNYLKESLQNAVVK
jgi:hypothetical protein